MLDHAGDHEGCDEREQDRSEQHPVRARNGAATGTAAHALGPRVGVGLLLWPGGVGSAACVGLVRVGLGDGATGGVEVVGGRVVGGVVPFGGVVLVRGGDVVRCCGGAELAGASTLAALVGPPGPPALEAGAAEGDAATGDGDAASAFGVAPAARPISSRPARSGPSTIVPTSGPEPRRPRPATPTKASAAAATASMARRTLRVRRGSTNTGASSGTGAPV